MARRKLNVLFWGTYDLSKPRNRLLRDGLRQAGAELEECHESIWENVQDKSGLAVGSLLRHFFSACTAYPRLIARFVGANKPDVVLVGYLGQLDVLLLFPWARLRKVPVVWDQFISIYDTVVHDRQLLSPRHPLAWMLWSWEWLACRAAQRVLMDTKAHAAHVTELFGLTEGHVDSVWVGAETMAFVRADRVAKKGPFELQVLFYGQFIPLHGIETIVRAARILQNDAIHFTLIGRGQQAPKIEELLAEQPLAKLSWKPWVQYEQLIDEIERADVCLGIFGNSGKASRVIPNKVFQIVAAGCPLVTRDSPAIAELLSEEQPGVYLVPPADPQALAATLRSIASKPRGAQQLATELRDLVSPKAVGKQAIAAIETLLSPQRRD